MKTKTPVPFDIFADISYLDTRDGDEISILCLPFRTVWVSNRFEKFVTDKATDRVHNDSVRCGGCVATVGEWLTHVTTI